LPVSYSRRNNERAGRLGKCAKSESDEDECRAAAKSVSQEFEFEGLEMVAVPSARDMRRKWFPRKCVYQSQLRDTAKRR
jgi:hypothetical protein